MSVMETHRISEMEMDLQKTSSSRKTKSPTFLFTAILVCDAINRYKTVLCVRNEVSKAIQFEKSVPSQPSAREVQF
jgi:hypothetical protein